LTTQPTRAHETPLKTRGFQRGCRSLHGCQFYANFLNRLSLKRIEDDYAGFF
jgi:hypothetical protein